MSLHLQVHDHFKERARRSHRDVLLNCDDAEEDDSEDKLFGASPTSSFFDAHEARATQRLSRLSMTDDGGKQAVGLRRSKSYECLPVRIVLDAHSFMFFVFNNDYRRRVLERK